MGDDSDVEETPVTFQVKSSNDAKWSLTMEPSTTVADLKEKLSGSDFADVPAARQRLIYSGRVLKDGDTLGTYNVKDGHTIHLVKSAQSNQPAQQPASGSQASGTNTGRSTPGQAQAPAGVPSNIAAGTGNNPLAGLTGARYAGFAPLPGAGMFGPDGGMGPPPDTEQLLSMLENPQFQSSINEALQNPQLIDMMIQQNPMLRDMGPNVRQMLQSPFFRRMLTDPNMIRQMTQMQRSMGLGGAGGGAAGGGADSAFPAPGVTNTTPQDSQGQQQQQDTTGQGAQGNQANQNPFGMPGMMGQGGAGNPFAALFGGGGFPPAPGAPGGAEAGNGASTQPPGNPEAQQTTPATAGAQNPTDPAAAAAGGTPGANQPNPFASLFNPALLGNAGANPSGDPQQQGQNQQNPFANLANNNPFLQDPALFNQMLQTLGGGQNADQANNPFASLLGMGGAGAGAGAGAAGGGAPSQPDNRPPEERYAEQLSQLNDMGFFDFDRNVEALRRAGGNVQGAVEHLLGGS